MPQTLTNELYWLAMTILMTGLLWVPYIINRVRELGPPPSAWFPLPDPPPRAAWAARAMRAHTNAVENLVVFAPLVLVVQMAAANNVMTAWACKIYFFTRLAHYLICLLGCPILFRTLAFLIGVAAQLTLVWHILH